MSIQKSTIVVLIPCLNEEITIGKVIRDFQKSIPEAQIIVFDNNSTDRSASIAHESGAKVIKELRPGKGHVMANMFRKVEADYYVIVDGDDTYSAEHVRQLLEPVLDESAEMSVAARLEEYTEQSFRPFHIFGNKLVRRLVNWIFHSNLTDIMSGYRACSRELVKAVPIFSSELLIMASVLWKFRYPTVSARKAPLQNCVLFMMASAYFLKLPESPRPTSHLLFLVELD